MRDQSSGHHDSQPAAGPNYLLRDALVPPTGEPVRFWPNGVWCSLSEQKDILELTEAFGDDCYDALVEEWEPDGTPAARYFL